MTGDRSGCTRAGGPGIRATTTVPDREENWALTTAQFGGWPVSTRMTDWCRHRAGERTERAGRGPVRVSSPRASVLAINLQRKVRNA
jgi:hypothetical protein